MYTYDISKQYEYLVYIFIFHLVVAIVPITLAAQQGKYTEGCLNFFADSYITIKEDWIEKITVGRGRNTVNMIGVEARNPELDKKIETNMKRSFFMSWNMIHVYNLFLYGLFVPHLAFYVYILGIFAEMCEYYLAKCHDIFDLLYNGIGLLIGIGFHYLIFNTTTESIFHMKSMTIAIIFLLLVSVAFNGFIVYRAYSHHKRGVAKKESELKNDSMNIQNMVSNINTDNTDTGKNDKDESGSNEESEIKEETNSSN
jgi:hypothetical protein